MKCTSCMPRLLAHGSCYMVKMLLRKVAVGRALLKVLVDLNLLVPVNSRSANLKGPLASFTLT